MTDKKLTFLNLIDKYFPKGHKLHKCFNRSNVKATYCTLTNMKDVWAYVTPKLFSKCATNLNDIVPVNKSIKDYLTDLTINSSGFDLDFTTFSL